MKRWMGSLLGCCAAVLLGAAVSAQAPATPTNPSGTGVGTPSTPTNPTDTGTLPPGSEPSASPPKPNVPTGTDTTPGSSTTMPGQTPSEQEGTLPDSTIGAPGTDGGMQEGVPGSDINGPDQGVDQGTQQQGNVPGSSGTGSSPTTPGGTNNIPR